MAINIQLCDYDKDLVYSNTKWCSKWRICSIWDTLEIVGSKVPNPYSSVTEYDDSTNTTGTSTKTQSPPIRQIRIRPNNNSSLVNRTSTSTCQLVSKSGRLLLRKIGNLHFYVITMIHILCNTKYTVYPFYSLSKYTVYPFLPLGGALYYP